MHNVIRVPRRSRRSWAGEDRRRLDPGTGPPAVVNTGSPSRSPITSIASGLESQSTGRRPSSSAAAPSVPLPAKKSSTSRPARARPRRSGGGRRPASGSGSRSSRCRSARRSCATRRRSGASRAPPSPASRGPAPCTARDRRPRCRSGSRRVLHVDEDRVVLRRPPPLRARAVVVGPDDLVQEAVAPEDLVEEHLAVVRLAVVEVEVERAVVARAGAGLAQPRLEEAEVVVEGVGVGEAPARRP